MKSKDLRFFIAGAIISLIALVVFNWSTSDTIDYKSQYELIVKERDILRVRAARQDTMIMFHRSRSLKSSIRAHEYKLSLDSTLLKMDSLLNFRPTEQTRINAREWINTHNASL